MVKSSGTTVSTGPHGYRVPARLQADVDVQPVVTCRLRVTAQAQLVEEVPALQGGGADLLEADALGGIKVDPELVGVVGVGR